MVFMFREYILHKYEGVGLSIQYYSLTLLLLAINPVILYTSTLHKNPGILLMGDPWLVRVVMLVEVMLVTLLLVKYFFGCQHSTKLIIL